MRLRDGLHVEWVDAEAVVLEESTGAIHYLNETAAIFFALVAEHGYERGVEEFRHHMGSSEEIVTGLSDLVADMLERGLLSDDIAGRVSSRDH